MIETLEKPRHPVSNALGDRAHIGFGGGCGRRDRRLLAARSRRECPCLGGRQPRSGPSPRVEFHTAWTSTMPSLIFGT